MRTQQDNDISLYSLDELRAMQNRYKGNYKGWQPFTAKEVNAEIIQREMTPELINTAKKWLSGGYSEAYIQSQMYAARKESTSIFHIAADKKTKKQD